MKCALCKERPAEVAIKQVMDGAEREMQVCRACAQRAAGKLVGSLVEMLLDAAIDLQVPPREEPSCAGCGLPRAEFRSRQRVGCVRCYETFRRDLAPMLRDMHRGDHHVGKIPARERIGRKRTELEAALRAAIRAQRYEDAAVLRDRLRDLGAATPREKGAAPEGEPRPAPEPGGDHAAS
jgi:protein arginine kinase activator